jgi:hypothetical protein
MWANEIRMAFIDSEMAKRYQPESNGFLAEVDFVEFS